MPLTPVEQALKILTQDLKPLDTETVSLHEAEGRVLSENITAKITQPPFNASAMDGYAANIQDLKSLPARLHIIGESSAGHKYNGAIIAGKTVKISTGAVIPEGADTIILKENIEREGDYIIVKDEETQNKHIRFSGIDFKADDILLKSGQALSAKDLALAAAMNHATLNVHLKPKVAILASGDELVEPGEIPSSDQIISSIPYGLAPMIRKWGADPILLGIAKDERNSLIQKIKQAHHSDILVTLGGASVGDHDLMQQSLLEQGMQLHFWKIAMRPGKPMISGKINNTHVLGLPGNPVSSFVCAHIFLSQMIYALLGRKDFAIKHQKAILINDLPKNGIRQHYMRAISNPNAEGRLEVQVFEQQDSSLINIFAKSNCLVIREPNAPPAYSQDLVNIIPLI